MLEEEEQLEAAGLERERKMLEKVILGIPVIALKPRGVVRGLRLTTVSS